MLESILAWLCKAAQHSMQSLLQGKLEDGYVLSVKQDPGNFKTFLDTLPAENRGKTISKQEGAGYCVVTTCMALSCHLQAKGGKLIETTTFQTHELGKLYQPNCAFSLSGDWLCARIAICN